MSIDKMVEVMKSGDLVRQGDVALIRVDQAPSDAAPMARGDDPRGIVLAHGEVSGHAHAILASTAHLYAHGEDRYVVVGGQGTTLRHQTPDLRPTGDHGFITSIPSGTYRVEIQREWVDDEIYTVAD